jgi:hypothetical protein
MAVDYRTFSARLPQRELVIVAYQAGMLGCSTSEVAKYAILRLNGMSHDEAKAEAMSTRTIVEALPDMEKVTSVSLPVKTIEIAQGKVPGANNSTILRYALTRLSMTESEARQASHRKPGRRKAS